jgi:hypothetical protein
MQVKPLPCLAAAVPSKAQLAKRSISFSLKHKRALLFYTCLAALSGLFHHISFKRGLTRAFF